MIQFCLVIVAKQVDYWLGLRSSKSEIAAGVGSVSRAGC